MTEADGAYSLVILTRDAVYGVRDPLGLRPLCIGRLPKGTATRPATSLASESCALGTIGAEFVREVRPGEIVRLDADGLHSRQAVDPAPEPAFCIFEYVYFARPDSVIESQTVHRVRQRLGEALAREHPVDADIVVGVPDSATPAAIGYAIASDLPYTEGLIKNRYIGRTFIQPDDRLRKAGVHLKYNPLRANLEGQRVVLVDDSIVRGNTAGPLVKLLREGGAVEVHVRVSSPPVRHPCFMGIDMARGEDLIGYSQDRRGDPPAHRRRQPGLPVAAGHAARRYGRLAGRTRPLQRLLHRLLPHPAGGLVDVEGEAGVRGDLGLGLLDR